MSLAVAFNSARSSLLNATGQIAVSAKNVAGASDPAYSRKLAMTTTTADGSARLLSVGRATDLAVYGRMLGATSASAQQDALLSGIERLQQTIGDAEDGWSPAALLGDLDSALQQYASSPDTDAYAQQLVTKADALAKGLNDATTSVQAVRAQADADMARSVARINELLQTFQGLNVAIVKGTALAADVTDEMDARDSIVAQLSEELGVDVVVRAGNDMALYADSGVTLFDKSARTVTFEPTLAYGAATTGGSVRIDGVPVAGPDVTTQGLRSGRLLAYSELRDEVAVTYQAQLDEIARGLISTFAEVDQTGAGVDRVGLFAWSNAAPPSDVAASETIVPGVTAGLAGLIKVNRVVDPAEGGDATLVRDGGANGADYVYNAGGMASYSDRLTAVADTLGGTRTDFSPSTELPSTQSLAGFAASSIGWLEGRRSAVSSEADYQSTLLATASTALSNSTGVNVDDEYARQLQLEQAYQASAKLLGLVDELFDTLFAAVG